VSDCGGAEHRQGRRRQRDEKRDQLQQHGVTQAGRGLERSWWGEDRARSLPHLRTARRGVSVATTGTLSRVLGARTGAGQRLASERAAALSPEKSGGNRAGSLGVRVRNERQRPRLAAPRWQQPHLRTGGGGIVRPRGGVAAKAKRIAWWERRGSGGLRERDASRRSGVQLAAAICASIRRGQRERNGKGEGWTLCVVVSEGKGMPYLG